MIDREQSAARARAFFDDIWSRGDPWDFETSPFERDRYAHLLGILNSTEYDRVLEIGCGAGAFTRLLAPRCRNLIALDVSAKAIEAARSALPESHRVEFRAVNAMEFDLKREGPWDLIVMSETIYYLGWLYSFFDVCWFAGDLFAATRPGGQLLLADVRGDIGDPLLLPSLTDTYHDLFVNVGYGIDTEGIFRGEKNGVSIEVLISRFRKPADASGEVPST